MKRRNALGLVLLSMVALGLGWITWLFLRPLPEIPRSTTLPAAVKNVEPQIAWPAYGQESLGALGWGELDTNGEQTSVPTASVAKIITALAVLQKYPLSSSQQGPTLTLDSVDTGYFESHYINGGSVVAVKNGEQISQYQALQAMLLPSGNNMADSLARWAFGSQENYLIYANDMLKKMGLKSTVVADASGYSPQTVSTAEELLKIATEAMQQPVLAKIVAQESATVPVAGKINNVNWLLGEDGVIGIKTGSTDQAGGNFLFAAKKIVDGQDLILTGAILGAPLRNTAISDSRGLINSAASGFKKAELIKKDQVLGYYSLPWGDKVNVSASQGLSGIVWSGKPVEYKVNLINLPAGTKTGAIAGTVTVSNGQKTYKQTLVLEDDLIAPSLKWRINRN